MSLSLFFWNSTEIGVTTCNFDLWFFVSRDGLPSGSHLLPIFVRRTGNIKCNKVWLLMERGTYLMEASRFCSLQKDLDQWMTVKVIACQQQNKQWEWKLHWLRLQRLLPVIGIPGLRGIPTEKKTKEALTFKQFNLPTATSSILRFHYKLCEG